MPVNQNQVTIYINPANRELMNRLLWELAKDGTLPISKQTSLSAMVVWLVRQEMERRGLEQIKTPDESIQDIQEK